MYLYLPIPYTSLSSTNVLHSCKSRLADTAVTMATGSLLRCCWVVRECVCMGETYSGSIKVISRFTSTACICSLRHERACKLSFFSSKRNTNKFKISFLCQLHQKFGSIVVFLNKLLSTCNVMDTTFCFWIPHIVGMHKYAYIIMILGSCGRLFG